MLTRTVASLCEWMKTNKIHNKTKQQTVHYQLPDKFSKGISLTVQDFGGKGKPTEDDTEEEDEFVLELDDLND